MKRLLKIWTKGIKGWRNCPHKLSEADIDEISGRLVTMRSRFIELHFMSDVPLKPLDLKPLKLIFSSIDSLLFRNWRSLKPRN